MINLIKRKKVLKKLFNNLGYRKKLEMLRYNNKMRDKLNIKLYDYAQIYSYSFMKKFDEDFMN